MKSAKTWRAGLTAGAGLLAALILAACGGGSGGSGSGGTTTGGTTMGSGQFIDSAVQGLTYVSGGITGTTDAAGTFEYEVGQTVTFSVGGITLGTVTPQTIITPVNLVTGATDETNPTVTNIARFLQTIDDDGDPDNGITIPANVVTAAANLDLDFAQSAAAFEGDADVVAAIAALTAKTTSGVRPLVTSAAAQLHLKSSLLDQLAGTYKGTFSGSFGGSFSVTLNDLGVVSGGGADQFGNPFTVVGSVSSNGEGTFGYAGCADFAGQINSVTGALSGTWSGVCGSGTYAGQKQ